MRIDNPVRKTKHPGSKSRKHGKRGGGQEPVTQITLPDGQKVFVQGRLNRDVMVDFYREGVALAKPSAQPSTIMGPDGRPANADDLEAVPTTFEERQPWLLQSSPLRLGRKMAEFLVLCGISGRLSIVLHDPRLSVPAQTQNSEEASSPPPDEEDSSTQEVPWEDLRNKIVAEVLSRKDAFSLKDALSQKDALAEKDALSQKDAPGAKSVEDRDPPIASEDSNRGKDALSAEITSESELHVRSGSST